MLRRERVTAKWRVTSYGIVYVARALTSTYRYTQRIFTLGVIVAPRGNLVN